MEYKDDIFVELYKFHKKKFPVGPCLIRPLYVKKSKIQQEKKELAEKHRMYKRAFTESRLFLEAPKKSPDINRGKSQRD